MEAENWYAYNKLFMRKALDRLFDCLTNNESGIIDVVSIVEELSQGEYIPAFMSFSDRFGLDNFERLLLLFCAGTQLDRQFCELCANRHGEKDKGWLSFDLALRLVNQGEWRPFTTQSSLRYWHIIEPENPLAASVSRLRLDDYILHYLTGNPVSDSAIEPFLLPMPVYQKLVDSHQAIAEQIRRIFDLSMNGQCPIVLLDGGELDAKPSIALAATGLLGMQLHRIDSQVLPGDSQALHQLYKRLEREAILHHCVFLFEGDIAEHNNHAANSLIYLLKRLSAPCIVATSVKLSHLNKDVIKLEVKRPLYQEQSLLWEKALNGSAGPDDLAQLPLLLDQFDLGAQQIKSIAHQWHSSQLSPRENQNETLWTLCRQQARHKLAGLAKVIEPVVGENIWDSLVLPSDAIEVIKLITRQVKQRHRVYQQWGFADQSSTGLGISALFVGGSGTGKTLAARVIGSELNLDIYHIDLSAIVSKYIGETEKNLECIFNAAQSSGAILLFDEADALFGKRSQVNDSKDRYANMEVSYLLQRMESYAGLSILTSNLRNNLDDAFVRRLRFIVQFSFPEDEEREAIWRSVFPQSAPLYQIDFSKLARLEVSGGLIKSIAVNAAFHAANEEQDIRMTHIKQAVMDEYAKTEKTLLPELIADW